ncbi:NAD(P)-binding protein [Aspergillus filifer]
MPQQTVFRLCQRTGINNLTTVQEPIPTPTRHEVLIKIHAVSLNARDLQIANNEYPMPANDNIIPCSDGAGEIAEIGEGVAEFQKGDRVVVNFNVNHLYGTARGYEGQQGGFIDGVLAQYIVRPVSCVVRVPGSARQSYAELASLVCTGVTVWNGLFGNVQLKPGQTVLVQGTGGVSLTALVLAKAAGATTIITSSSNEKLSKVQEKFGPDYTINYKEYPEWGSRALELIGQQGVDHIIEIGGVGTIEQSIKALAFGGHVSVVGYLADIDPSEMPNVLQLALSKAAVVRGILIGPKCMLEELVTYADRARLVLPVEKEFGYSREEVLQAYRELEKGALGKVCIRVD